MKHVELLSPAGTLKNMRYAFAFGADAVYAGLPRYSLRVRNNDFLEDNLAKGIAEAHQLKKKFFWRPMSFLITPRLKPLLRTSRQLLPCNPMP